MFMHLSKLILGCFWVIFWPQNSLKFSILFGRLTSVHMQDDVSDILQFLLQYLKMIEIGSKSLFSGSFLLPQILSNEGPYEDIYLG